MNTPSNNLTPHRAFSTQYGTLDIDSTPPANTTSVKPVSIWSAPLMIASMADVHTLFIVTAGTAQGIPPSRAEILAMFKAFGGSKQFPNLRSPMIAGSNPARSTAALITSPPSSGACKSFNDPPKVPIGLRHADTTTISFMSELQLRCLISSLVTLRQA